MIRFSASLVVVALGLLVAGGVTSKLLLVYVAIAVSAIALVFLIIGAILNRGELRASSPAEGPGDRLDEASTGRLDRAPADDREEAGPGRPDSVAAGVSGDDLTGRPDRLAAGARGDDPAARPDTVAGMHGQAPMVRPTAASTASVTDTKDPGDIADHTGPNDNSSANDSSGPRSPNDTRSPGDSTSPEDTRSPSGISTPEHTNSASDTSSAVDTSGSGDTENVKDTGGTGGIEDLADTQPAGQVVTVVPGVARYHRSECILIRFMGDSDLQKMPTWAARKAGCAPCRACHTDGEETG